MKNDAILTNVSNTKLIFSLRFVPLSGPVYLYGQDPRQIIESYQITCHRPLFENYHLGEPASPIFD